MRKRITIANSEVEVYDNDPIERMRHRDTDGDGIADYVDSNGYTKPNDKYQYREISRDEVDKLRSGGFDVANNVRPSKSNPERFILRFTDNQKTEIDNLVKPVLHRTRAR